jgi:hypothetical protein
MWVLEPALLQATAAYQLQQQQQQEQQSEHHVRMIQATTASIMAQQTQVAMAQLQQQPPPLQVHEVEEQQQPHRPRHHHHQQHPQVPDNTISTMALPSFLPNIDDQFMLGSDGIVSSAGAPAGERTMKLMDTRRR